MKVDELNDRVTAFIDREEFLVKFLEEDNSVREADLVTTELRHLLHSLIMTEDVNSYQSGSHLEYMMKAYTWKGRMQDFVQEANMAVEANQPTFREMLRGLKHTARYIDESFEERVDELDPPND